ncbi:hypothetical protein BDW74DRAFT_183842 [Aspergillus multicolor]|uniref:uncharacterized protein n=1 Tax=Aspergillus multicolor TaxID=41759 RepID=UPI003CCD68E0
MSVREYTETASITPAVLKKQRRFCAALEKAMDWVLSNDAETYKEEVVKIFPTISPQLLIDITNVYRRNEMWTTPTVTRFGFDRWQQGLADGRLIQEPFAYEDIVNEKATSSDQHRA